MSPSRRTLDRCAGRGASTTARPTSSRARGHVKSDATVIGVTAPARHLTRTRGRWRTASACWCRVHPEPAAPHPLADPAFRGATSIIVERERSDVRLRLSLAIIVLPARRPVRRCRALGTGKPHSRPGPSANVASFRRRRRPDVTATVPDPACGSTFARSARSGSGRWRRVRVSSDRGASTYRTRCRDLARRRRLERELP